MNANQIQVATLAHLKEHMTGLIWERDDMSIRDARIWLILLSQTSGDALKARFYGFDYLHTKDDIIAAESVLTRFVTIFGNNN